MCCGKFRRCPYRHDSGVLGRGHNHVDEASTAGSSVSKIGFKNGGFGSQGSRRADVWRCVATGWRARIVKLAVEVDTATAKGLRNRMPGEIKRKFQLFSLL